MKLGGQRDATMKCNDAVRERAKRESEHAMKAINPTQAAGESLSAIASRLNDLAVPTSRGRLWTAKQVSRVIERVG